LIILALGSTALVSYSTLAFELPALERSVSISRQFVVYNSDVHVRAALCNVAERTKGALLALLQTSDQWKTPIVINASLPQANLPELPPAALNVSQTGVGLKLQLDLTIGPDLNAPVIERELLRVILLEMVYRAKPNLPPGAPYVRPPEWLIDGILALGSQRDPIEFGAPLKALATSNKIVSLQNFLQQRTEPLDSPSREIYRSYSYVLVSLLSRGHLMAKYIADLADAPNDTTGDLLAHCPKLGASNENAERVWKSSVIDLAGKIGYGSLTVVETERRLETLLHFQFPASKEPDRFWALEEYPSFRRFSERAVVLNKLTEDLMVLGVRANPMSRPVVQEYQNIAFRLARGKTRGVAGRLTRVRNARDLLVARVQEIDDYMNWFEATRASAPSGTFAGYLKTPQEAVKSRRRDAISIYLDSIEIQVHE
jgi:hypothetical protein